MIPNVEACIAMAGAELAFEDESLLLFAADIYALVDRSRDSEPMKTVRKIAAMVKEREVGQ
jgi:hypothetical protein